MIWNFIDRKSMFSILFFSVCPKPAMIFMASITAMQPIIPDTAPKTGNSRVQIGGWPGYKQAKQGVSLGIIVVT